VFQGRQLFGIEAPPFAGPESAETERSIADSLQVYDRMADGIHHEANLTLAAFVQH